MSARQLATVLLLAGLLIVPASARASAPDVAELRSQGQFLEIYGRAADAFSRAEAAADYAVYVAP